jgi:dihydrofolate reductase
MSLDGYIADEDGGVAWLDPYMDAAQDFMKFMKEISAAIVGRTTYDHALRMGRPFGGSGTPTWVLTHRPIEPLPKGVFPWTGDLKALLEDIDRKARPGDIWLMGGGKAILPFHEAGLIDRWEIGLIPTVLGNGIPMFLPSAKHDAALRLVETKSFPSGTVALTYERAPARTAKPARRRRSR